MSLQFLVLFLMTFPVLPNLVQKILGLDGKLSILDVPLILMFRKFVNSLVETKNLLSKLFLELFMVLYVGLYVVLV